MVVHTLQANPFGLSIHVMLNDPQLRANGSYLPIKQWKWPLWGLSDVKLTSYAFWKTVTPPVRAEGAQGVHVHPPVLPMCTFPECLNVVGAVG